MWEEEEEDKWEEEADPVWRLGLESLLTIQEQQGVRRLDEVVQVQAGGSPSDSSDEVVWSPGLEVRLGACLEEEVGSQAVPGKLLAPKPIETPAKEAPSHNGAARGGRRPSWRATLQPMDLNPEGAAREARRPSWAATMQSTTDSSPEGASQDGRRPSWAAMVQSTEHSPEGAARGSRRPSWAAMMQPMDSPTKGAARGSRRPSWAVMNLMLQSMEQDEDYMLPMPPIQTPKPPADAQQQQLRGMVNSRSAASFFQEYQLEYPEEHASALLPV